MIYFIPSTVDPLTTARDPAQAPHVRWEEADGAVVSSRLSSSVRIAPPGQYSHVRIGKQQRKYSLLR